MRCFFKKGNFLRCQTSAFQHQRDFKTWWRRVATRDEKKAGGKKPRKDAQRCRVNCLQRRVGGAERGRSGQPRGKEGRAELRFSTMDRDSGGGVGALHAARSCCWFCFYQSLMSHSWSSAAALQLFHLHLSASVGHTQISGTEETQEAFYSAAK